jgi:hypothetical protein
VDPVELPSKFFVVDASKFRRGYKKIIQVSIRYATPWFEYRLDWGGLVKKLRCDVMIDEQRVRVTSICREVDKAKEFLLMPVLIIRPSEDVLTVVTVD